MEGSARTRRALEDGFDTGSLNRDVVLLGG